jgi:uracil-DNA glycosylase
MLHHSWHEVLLRACEALDREYRDFLERNYGYFPSRENYLNAFKTLPRERVKYILFGQDPYPRAESAGGYAFIDEKVQTLFSDKGLSKEVNRATSLRNFMKMALVAKGDLCVDDTSQDAIAALDKTSLINTVTELRMNFEKNGVLLLNTALIFTDKKSSNRHIREWRPFMQSLLHDLNEDAPELILFGTHAKALKKHLFLEPFRTIELEHPYNHTFISNKNVLNLFRPMNLLEK